MGEESRASVLMMEFPVRETKVLRLIAEISEFQKNYAG